MSVTEKDDTSTQFFGLAALQLLDHKTEVHKEIAAVMPAILSVLSDAKLAKTTAGEVLQRFIHWFEADSSKSTKASATSGLVKCGWLRKISNSSITTQKRWVVLDGGTLMYYSDKSETDLRGLIQLNGASVNVSKRTFHFNIGASGYAFDMKPASDSAVKPGQATPHQHGGPTTTEPLSGPEDLETGRSTPSLHHFNSVGDDSAPKDGEESASGFLPRSMTSPSIVPARRRSSVHAGEVAKAKVATPALNPLHESKKVYTWVCDTEEERESWMSALREAIEIGSGEAGCLAWARQFSAAATIQDYMNILTGIEELATPLTISADWARVHMAALGRRSHSTPLPRASKLMHQSLVKLPEESGAIGVSVVKDPLLGVASPRNKKLLRHLLRHDGAARAMREQADRKEKLVPKAEAAELLRESAVTALASAEVSSQRRRGGRTPGDRVTVFQLMRDTERDTVLLDGVLMDAPDITAMVLALVDRIVSCINDAFKQQWETAQGAPPPASVFLKVAGRVDPESPYPQLQMQLLEFAREVLMCSSRTVLGGDIYDALELIFQNQELIMMRPDGSTNCPLEISLHVTPDAGAEASNDELPIPDSKNVDDSTPTERMTLPRFSDAASDESGDSTTAGTARGAKLPPLRLPSATPPRHNADIRRLPVVAAAVELLPFLSLQVRTRMKYNLLHVSDSSDFDEPPVIGNAIGAYKRSFPWDKPSESADITVSVEDIRDGDAT